MHSSETGSEWLATTLIVGLVGDAELFVGADTAVTTDREVVVPSRKLDYRTDPPIPWGFSGNEDMGLRFGEWLRRQQITDWPSFRDAVEKRINDLNGERRRNRIRAGLQGSDLESNDCVSVLVGGVINREYRVLTIDAAGTVSSLPNSLGASMLALGVSDQGLIVTTAQRRGSTGDPLRVPSAESDRKGAEV